MDILKDVFLISLIIIVRLLASRETVKRRLTQRDSGKTLREHLNEIDEMKLEYATVETDAISVEEIAQRVITIAGWK